MDITSPASQDKQAPAVNKAAGKKGKGRKRRMSGAVKLLILALVVAAAGGGFYAWKTLGTASAAEQPTIALAVTKGDLNVTVQSNGNVAATREETVSYKTAGTVVEVLVKSGDKVEAGQDLVRQTDTDQKAAVAQAQAALNTAQAKLDDLKKGPTEAEIGSAQADVNSAQAALDQLKAGSSKKDIADAQADLRNAQANMSSVKAGATAKELADAQTDLRTAQANYDKVKAGATAKELADAQTDLKTAQAAYDALVAPASQSDLKQAQSNLAAAKANLAAVKAKPTQTELSTAQLAVTTDEQNLQSIQTDAALAKQKDQLAMEKADRDLGAAQLAYSVIADQVLNENGELTVVKSDPKYTSYWDAYNAMKDAEATQAEAKATLDNTLQKEVEDVAAAQAKLDDAKKQLAEVQAGATPAEIASAQADVDTAQKTYDDLVSGPSKSEVATAQATVDKAQTALDQLKAGPTAADLATAQATVDKAQTALDQLKAGPTAADIATAQMGVDKAQNNLNDLLAGTTPDKIAAAQATLASKQSALASLTQPATASDIAAAEEAVASAQDDLNTANENLTKTVLKAPFTGTIASVTAEPNAEATVGSEALTIYDESGMHLELSVNESDIQKLKTGEEASITVDAVPNEVFTGTVTEVSNVATTSQDVVTYKVNVEFNPRGQAVKTGMSATADITVESHSNVIQVPTRALTTQSGQRVLKVLYGSDQTPVEIAVTTGASNSTHTEITGCVDTGNQCLREGDQVAVTISTSTGNSGNNGFGTFPVGGNGVFIGGGFGGQNQGRQRGNP
jgi:HlyD family secretion protein